MRLSSPSGLLEREDELDLLEEVVEAAIAGSGSSVLVSGEAGIGKTSLIRMLRAQTGGRVRFFPGACEPLSVPVPLQPLRELLDAVGAQDLLALDSDDPHILARSVLDALSKQAPAIAVIEDAHWADPLTLDLLRILARRVEDRALGLLITYREDEVAANRPLRLLVGDLATSPSIRRIRLRPLSAEAVGQLAEPEGIDPHHLVAITGGNPFLVVEAIAAGGQLPGSVRDGALARAERLTPAAREVVDIAAVVGQRFEPDLLRALSPDSAAAVEEAIARGVLVADGPLLGFRHELIREALESSLAPPRRADLHARVFEALRERPSEADDARLAHHADLAGLVREACRHAALAAAEAARMGAVHETYLQAERALRWPGHLAPEDRFELLLQYSRAANFTHPRLELAAEAAEQAVAVAQAQHDSVRQGRALLTLAWALWSLERVVQSREAVERALAVLEPTQDVAALARAHSARMRVEATAFDPAVAISEYPLTLDLATRAALDDVKLDATISFGLARGHRGLADGLDILWKALDAARAAGLTIQTVRTYVNLMTTAVSLRQHAVADRVRDEALPLFVEYRTAVPAMAVGAYHARSLLDRGRWDEAEAVFERSDSGWHGELPVARALLALIRARRGEPDCLGAAQAAWDGLCDMVPAESARHGMTRLAVVEVAWLEGAHEVAREHLRTGADSPSARRFARAAGELALWARRYGMPYEMPEQALAALVLELEGDWRGAIRAWRALEAPYEAALAALPGDDRAAREALATLHRLGARGAARAFDRERRARGARPARGPRRTTLANPAGLTRREQEVLEQLSTGATNSEIAATLHLSERTVAHHVSAVLAKLGARNRAAAIEHAHARGLLGQLRQPHSPR